MSKSAAAEIKINPKLDASWLDVLGSEFEKPYMSDLKAFLMEEKKRTRVFPPGKEMFNALNFTPFGDVRVVILGQDPYHNPGQAHGLCFSVRKDVDVPPSLVNIYKELEADIGVSSPGHGNLEPWARQGILLLNTVLSVRAWEANSHRGKGWENFTDRVIQELNDQRDGLVFVLWGRNAQAKEPMIDQAKHLVLTSPHPSPLSANRGFFGSKPFSAINEWLEQLGHDPIDWQIPA